MAFSVRFLIKIKVANKSTIPKQSEIAEQRAMLSFEVKPATIKVKNETTATVRA